MTSKKNLELISKQLHTYTKEELIRTVLQQQLQLQTYKAALGSLENPSTEEDSVNVSEYRWKCPVAYLLPSTNQIRELVDEDELSLKDGEDALFHGACAKVMIDIGLREEMTQLIHQIANEKQQRREKMVRSALRRLYDTNYLRRSLLAKNIINLQQGINGEDLQDLLFQAIESVKHDGNYEDDKKQQIRYDILKLTYLEKKNLANTKSELFLSERQYYRELKVAIRAVTDFLFDSFI